MAHQLLYTAKRAALSAHRKGESCVYIHGIVLLICHVQDDDYQVLLPDHTEIFRIAENGQKAEIYVM